MSFADTAVLFILALLLFGPKKLPAIARQVGKALNEFKRASNEFKAQIEAEISNLEFEERKKQREQEQENFPKPEPIAESIQAPSRYTLPENTAENASEAASSEGNTTSAENANSPATVDSQQDVNSPAHPTHA
ncbi:MAG TPA: twin-arginine translocase TatA/TatE family subunit [Terriglobales bacterium]|jgi:sec-independent protein translocase protein TatB